MAQVTIVLYEKGDEVKIETHFDPPIDVDNLADAHAIALTMIESVATPDDIIESK